jgi:hypothetical protein
MRPGLLDGGPGGKPPGKQLHFLPRARQRRPFNPPVPFESWRVPCRACLRILGSGKRNVRIRGEPWLFCELIWRAAATRRLSVSARGECLRRHASRAAFWRSGRHCAPRDNVFVPDRHREFSREAKSSARRIKTVLTQETSVRRFLESALSPFIPFFAV